MVLSGSCAGQCNDYSDTHVLQRKAQCLGATVMLPAQRLGCLQYWPVLAMAYLQEARLDPLPAFYC